MRLAFFYQSVISDWNHGNAHMLRGLMRALQARGHECVCFEPVDSWSLANLLTAMPDAIERFEDDFPDLRYERYATGEGLPGWLDERLCGVDAVVVNEWTEPAVVRLVREAARRHGAFSVFYDTHYRVSLDPGAREQLGVEDFDLILGFSPSVAERYRALGFANVEVLHEAADVSVFYPREAVERWDAVFVGNYGDGDRDETLDAYVFDLPRRVPGLRLGIFGVRYPPSVLERLSSLEGATFEGAARNVEVPCIYSAARSVLHVPRGPYRELLPGTPTIRVFEALACGAPLVSLPWDDTDHLFEVGSDYLVVETPEQMRDTVKRLMADPSERRRLGDHGRRSILARHTCGHRADQLLEMLGQ